MRRLRGGFTTRASCLLAAGLTAVLCGLVLGEVDLFRAGVLAAVLPCVAAVLVRRTQVRITSRRAASALRVSAGESVTVALHITNGSPLPTGSLMLEDRLPEQLPGHARFMLDSLASRQSREVSYRVPQLDRGRYRIGPLQLRLTDPFGLIDLTRAFTAVSELTVTPVVDPLPQASLPVGDDLGDSGGSHSVGAHGADDASTREYRTGDDLRKIHWRSTARTGALMVRQEERPARGATTLLLDLRATAHGESALGQLDARLRSSLEWAISAAASIGTHVLAGGRPFGLLGEPVASAGNAIAQFESVGHLLERLATARASTLDLAGLLASAQRQVRESTLLAVLGRLDERTLDGLAAVHGRRGGSAPSAVLLDVDSWESGARGPRTHLPAPTAAALLRTAGWRVTVARRGEPVALAWQLLFAGTPSAVPSYLAAAPR